MKIYVGNLSYEVNEQDLRQQFEPFGGVDSVSVITDKYSGRSKGFAFIEMGKKAEGEAAIMNLNGKTLNERTIVVNEARPRTDNRSSNSYDNRRNSSYGGGKQKRY